MLFVSFFFRSFKAQRKCEESKIAECPYSKHKLLIRTHLNKLEDTLKCGQSAKPDSEAGAGNGSAPGVSNDTARPFRFSIAHSIAFGIWISRIIKL
jgi:hypothetical protein